MAQTPRAPRFTPGLSQSDLAAGYEKIGSRPPFTKSDVQKAYEPYGLKLDPGRKGASDTQLNRTAGRAVVDWFKKSKAAEASAAAKAAAAARAAAQKTSPTQAPASIAPAASTGTSAPRATATFSSSRIQALLAQGGFVGATPPAYALVSEEALLAWIARAQRYAAPRPRATGYPVLPRQYATAGTPMPIATNRAPVVR